MAERDSRKFSAAQQTTIASSQEPKYERAGHYFAPIARLATANDGIVSIDQLREIGLSRSQVSRLCDLGYLHRVRRRAYAVGRRAIPEHGHIRAVAIALRGRCIASHHSAAYLWGIGGRTRPIHVIRPDGARRDLDRVRSHRVRDFASVPRTRLHGLPVTTVARTLRDLAAVLSLEDLEDIAARAQRRRLLNVSELHSQHKAQRGLHGAPRFTQFLSRIDPNVLATRSRMERRILHRCQGAGLRRPEAARTVAGYEVDLLWDEERLIVEFDSRAFHTDARAFERDRRRDAAHLAAGYRTLRITYSMWEEDPEGIVHQIAGLLAESRSPKNRPP